MAGAWYYLSGQECMVKTTVTRIYGSQQWCPDAPTLNKGYNVHEWNRLFPGYYCPPLSHCGQPPQQSQTGAPVSGGSPSGGGVIGQGASGVTSGVAGPGQGSPVTGKPPIPAEPGCAPAMAIVDGELGFSHFSGSRAGDGEPGGGHDQGFGHSSLDQMAQPLVAGITALGIYGSNGRPTYNQPYKFRVEDELKHQTVHSFHEGTGDGFIVFHPPELQDYMLHGSGVNPGSRWPTTLSEVTVLLHNCSRADASTGDISITRLAFGNPLTTTTLPKSGSYFQHTASTGILNLVGTNASGVAHKVAHFRVDMALDVPQYSDAEQALLVSHRAGTLVWNTDDEVYQYWDGAAWVEFTTGSGAGDMLAANNLSDLASDDTAISNLVGGGTSRTPTELHDVGVYDTFAANHGRASLGAVGTLILSKTSVALSFGGTPTLGAQPRWHKITVPYNQAGLGDQAAATANATLFTLPSGGVIHSVVMKNTTAWNNGGGGARIEASVGITGTLNKYAASWRWDTAVSTTNFQLSTVVGAEAIGATTAIKMAWDASAGPVNLNTGTVGSLDVYILLSAIL